MIPVDSFAPNAKAIKVTIIIAIPLIPAFEIPNTTVAVNASTQAVVVISDAIDKNKKEGLTLKNQKYAKK